MNKTTDARALCLPPSFRNPYNVMVFKQALVEQLGIDEGFRAYCSLMELPETASLVEKPVCGLRSFAIGRATQYLEIDPGGAAFAVAPPKVIGAGDHRPLSGVSRSFFVACFADARVVSNSAVTEVDGIVLLDYQGSERDDVEDQIELDPRIFFAANDRAWVLEREQTKTIEVEEAFGSLLGPHSPAFGHWLGEYVPRYVAAVSAGVLPPVPVLIDAGMPRSHREALEFMLPAGADIIELEAGTAACVSRLWCAPGLDYYPLLGRPHGSIDCQAPPPGRYRPVLAEMRKHLDDVTASPTGIDRIYLSRTPQLRRHLENHVAVETLARLRGFTLFRPEQHSFAEQVRFIRHARYIMGPDGSAMFLSMFAEPGTKLCVLSHPFILNIVSYAAVFENTDITFLTGRVVRPNDEPGYWNFGFKDFADFEIDEGGLAEFLDEWTQH